MTNDPLYVKYSLVKQCICAVLYNVSLFWTLHHNWHTVYLVKVNMVVLSLLTKW